LATSSLHPNQKTNLNSLAKITHTSPLSDSLSPFLYRHESCFQQVLIPLDHFSHEAMATLCRPCHVEPLVRRSHTLYIEALCTITTTTNALMLSIISGPFLCGPITIRPKKNSALLIFKILFFPLFFCFFFSFYQYFYFSLHIIDHKNDSNLGDRGMHPKFNLMEPT
jgi:hypothetical protein